MNFETVPINSISQDPSNLNRHDRKSIDGIKAALRRFKQQKVIVVDAKGIILAGNGTYEAAQELGWPEIVIHRTMLTGPEAIAYSIADNKIAKLSDFDEEALAKTLASLRDDGVPIDDIGFTDEELAKLIKESEPEESGEMLTIADESASGSSPGKFLEWGDQRIPLTELEVNALNDRLKSHQVESGTSYGFVTRMLDLV